MVSADRKIVRSEPVFLTAEWRHLAMLNYEVDPGLLRPLIPSGTEQDSWSGKTFVSLVGFRFLNTKVWGVSLPLHRTFEEVNLRFYVRRLQEGKVRRGVIFIREIVPRRLIAAVARAVYNERYVALPMSHQITGNSSCLSVEYGWKLGTCKNRIKIVTKGEPQLPQDGSQEQFITEHYWGYANQHDGGCIEYQVRHPRWRVWNASEAVFDGNMEALYGEELNAVLKHPPASAFLAEGSEVSVHRGRSL